MLAGSGSVSKALKGDKLPTPQLQLMLLIEANRPEGARYVIVRKLVARILAHERARMVKEVYGKLTP